LDAALHRAIADPGLLPELYRLLADSVVRVPVASQAVAEGGPTVRLVVPWRDPADGTVYVPLFTSAGRLPSGKPEGVSIEQESLRKLIAHMPRAHFRLNPLGPATLYLPPEDAAMLLVDGTLHGGTGQDVVPEGTTVSICAPTEEVSGLIAAFRSHFARQPSAPAVYLYEMFRPHGDGLFHSLAVGVLAPYDATIAQDIGAILPAAYTGHLPVDVFFLDPSGELMRSLILLDITPVVQAHLTTTRQ
jgi:hypothetical protein